MNLSSGNTEFVYSLVGVISWDTDNEHYLNAAPKGFTSELYRMKPIQNRNSNKRETVV